MSSLWPTILRCPDSTGLEASFPSLHSKVRKYPIFTTNIIISAIYGIYQVCMKAVLFYILVMNSISLFYINTLKLAKNKLKCLGTLKQEK